MIKTCLPKTPFIWHLSSGSHHAIELYISIYKWSRDALYRVRSIYAANREAALRDRLNSIDTSCVLEITAFLLDLRTFHDWQRIRVVSVGKTLRQNIAGKMPILRNWHPSSSC